MVILMPLCRMAMGKRGEGLLESHRRKSGWGLRASRPSTILSRAGSQLVIKWQLAKKTQWPAAMPSWISLLAMGACTPNLLSHALFFSRSTVTELDCDELDPAQMAVAITAARKCNARFWYLRLQMYLASKVYSGTDLPLTKSNSEELGAHAALQSQLAQDLSGVHPSRQNKDEG